MLLFNEVEFVLLACAFWSTVITPFALTAWIYSRLSNAPGTLRGLEHGAKWQLTDYIGRQPKTVQSAHKWLRRAKSLSWFCYIAGIILALVTTALFQSLIPYFVGVVLTGLFFSIPHILNGVEALIVKAAIFPRYLWAGKREFTTGKKNRFAAYTRITIGLLLILAGPISALITGRPFISLGLR